ncbi:eIF2A-related protein [Dapis sp. BLCC M172]|uniref:WD40 domain-containing protein n=1 Tax=Dapis sp. BLCC M172 TaxID=2975281 RepID=UPI003CEABC51
MPNFHQNPELLSELIFALEMSQGEFRLFLARSNTLTQRDRLIQKLQASFSGNLAQLQLDESVGELYATIGQQLGDQQPDALMVWGLESVTDVDKLLVSMGLVREEFKNNFHFPILLWIDQEISRKFIRLIPDFESWTSLTVFETPTQELIDFIQQTSNCVYQKVLDNGAGIFLEHTALGVGEFVYQELLDAQQELSNREVRLEPKLEAGLEFVLGRTADNSEETALKHYQRSLELWQQLNNQVRVAHTYYYLGLLWRSYELWHGIDKDTSCSRTASYYQKSVEIFETANYPNLAAKFINAWGEILQTLEHWDKLETVAHRAIELHKIYSHPFREACAYSFIAEVELTKNHYQQAKKLAQKALKILNETLAKASNCTSRKEEINLDWEFSYHQGKYLFSLAKAEKGLGQIQASIARLEQAKHTTKPEYSPEFYIDILTELQEIYYQQKEYLKAFKIKQERQKIKQQFGFQAFVGPNRLRDIKLNINPALPQSKQRTNQQKLTQEIAASGRQYDVEKLLERISRPDYKLIVIHGQSGVGKSSILHAGLVPTLEGKSIDTRDVIVVLQRVYVNWISELAKFLEKKLQIIKNLTINSESLNSTEEIFEKLKNNAQSNLLTVIIFDQFEEFFFVNMEAKQKQEFAYFLQECLKISFVKIVLSLRSDYIHYLLEFNHLANLEVINHDILSKNVIYCLGNFTPSQAKSVIQGLTEKSQFKIDSELTEKLVEDLAEELGKIRPIELQVMGAQLQRDDITTLEKYMELGENPKAKLVEQYLESVVRDCGAENEKLAWLVLLLFTDDNNTRPLKTQAELMKESNFNAEELELVLKIFVDSGLVFLLPQNPADHYQLVHDYLVGFIRQRKEVGILQELKQEREERQKLQKRLVRGSVAAALVMAVLAIGMTVFGLDAIYERRRADKQRRLADKQTMLAKANEAKAHSILGQRLDELISAMEARQKQIDNGFPLTNETSIITDVLRVAVYKSEQNEEFREFNRLPRDQNKVSDVEFSQDGKMIATASHNGTVKLWNLQGQLLQILKGHNSSISDIDFSPDRKTILTASDNGTVKLWNFQGQLLQILKGHNSGISHVDFSPDGKIITTASSDGIVKLWSQQGELLQTLKGHNSGISNVDFSPDGKTITTASDDGIVKLWNQKGELLQTIEAHDNRLADINFSSDGKTIATSSDDGIVKLWNQQGELLQTIEAHHDRPSDVNFSSDGKMMATASDDGTVKLWNQQGQELQTLKGHNSLVSDVELRQDGKMMATAGDDGTVKLWNQQGQELQILQEYNSLVSDVAFSPDGKMMATASDDSTVKLWNQQGELLQTLQGYDSSVSDVEFSPDGKMMATASDDGTVKLWDQQGQLLQTLERYDNSVNSVALSDDGESIATASDDGTVKLWNKKGELLQTLKAHNSGISDVDFSSDGERMATASDDGMVKLWNQQGELLQTLEGHKKRVSDIAFSPDGKTIATASDDSTVKLWNQQGELLQTLKGHKSSVSDVDFSSDGKTIATASNDKTVKLWNRQGKLLQTIAGYKTLVSDVEFSPNGEIIATASRGKTVKLWLHLGIEDLTKRGCELLNDYLISHPQELEELRICQTDKRKEAAALSLVIEGEKLARESKGEAEKLKAAIAKFNQGLKWNSNLNLKPKVRAESLFEAEKLMQEGRKLAREGKIEAAIDKYQRAKELDKMALIPIWQNIDPKVKAQDEAVDQF